MIIAPHQRLTIFKEDDVTPLLGAVDGAGNVVVPTCSTDPNDARPYLQRAYELAEADVNFAEGSSDIGLLSATILDKRTVPSDQTTGWFTALLSDSAGNNRISGYRCLVEQQNASGTWYTVLNGIVADIMLVEETLVEYKLEIKDMRERERDVPLFERADGTVAIFPIGVVNGYGKFFNGLHTLDAFIPPVRGAKAKFIQDTSESRAGVAVITDMNGNAVPDFATTQKITEVSMVNFAFNNDGTLNLPAMTYQWIQILWRPWGSTGAFTKLVDMPLYNNAAFANFIGAYASTSAFNGPWSKVNNRVGPFIIMTSQDGSGLPRNQQDIEVVMAYAGPPSDDLPIFIEKSFGQLLKDCYDGVYSTSAPRIKYDQAAMAAMVANTPLARAKITDYVSDLRTWVQDNIYKPLGYAPCLNAKGEITPVKYALPDVSQNLVQLDDSNITHATWKHSYEDIYNKVTFVYTREVGAAKNNTTPPSNFFVSKLAEDQDVNIIEIHSSAALLGPKSIDYNPVTVRSLNGSNQNQPLTGNVLDELGAQLARLRAKELFDRFSWGAQRMVVKALRSNSLVASLNVGDWVMIASSYLPDYNSAKRGINRVAQIIKIQDLSPIERSMELLDGGPLVQPLNQPGVGNLFMSGGRVATPIVSIPQGADARVDYAVSPTLPDTNSGSWVFAGRISSVGTVYTPLMPTGQIVWIRARSEATGRRPSTWTNAKSITTVFVPAISNGQLIIEDGSNPKITWDAQQSTFGYRIWWQTYMDGSFPKAFTEFVDVNAADGKVTLPKTMRLRQTENIIIRMEPYDGWSGSSVAGNAFDPLMMKGRRISETYIAPTFREQQSQDETQGHLVLVEFDPQYRIIQCEFQHQSGVSGVWSNWIVDTSDPFSDDVTLADGDTSSIAYRITTMLDDGSMVISAGGQVQFMTGPVQGFVQCNVTLTAATATQENYVVTATSPGGVVQVELIEVTGSASLAGGPGVGVLSPSGTLWTFNRGAALGGAGQIHFRAIEPGFQTDDDYAEIPEQGRDTVPLKISAKVTQTTATAVFVDVSVVDPIPQSGDAYIQLVIDDKFTGGITPGTTQNVVSGGVISYVILRPAYKEGTGQAFWTAVAPNRVEDFDSVDVPALEQDTQYCECQAHIVSVSATQVTVQVDAVSKSGSPQVKLVSVSGSTSLISGAGVGSLVSGGSTWVFNRGAFQSGLGEARFRAVLSGFEDDDDMVEIAEIGRDTVALLIKATVTGVTATQVFVDVSVTDPQPVNSINISAPVVANCTISPSTSQNVTSGTTVSFVINRPAFGNGPGGVTFRASSLNRVDDADRVDVQCQEKTTFGSTLPSIVPTYTPGPTSYSIGYTATGIVTYQVDGGGFSTTPSNPFTVTRNAAGGADKVVTLKATLDGQSVVATVTVPAQDASAASSSFSFLATAYVSDGVVRLLWSYTGATPDNYDIYIDDAGGSLQFATNVIGTTSIYDFHSFYSNLNSGGTGTQRKIGFKVVAYKGYNTMATSAPYYDTYWS